MTRLCHRSGKELPTPPTVGLIVQKASDGTWRDDNGVDWSEFVTWDLHDHDVAVIDAGSLSVSYVTGLMNLNMAIAVHPAGDVTVVGTEATNATRFEPNIRGTFVRPTLATVPAADPAASTVRDLNPHLDYTTHTVPMEVRRQSIGDPRGIAWNAAGDRGYVSGMGSNNVIVMDADGGRVGVIEVGQGPTGLVVDDARGRLYVLNKFDASVSVVDIATMQIVMTVPFHDATPISVSAGRPLLYNTHMTSGLGQVSCASCHPDARMDQLAWDLGNPSGVVQEFIEVCETFDGQGACDDWHPMKGPLVTQTLVGTGESPPLHWRGDRATLFDFSPTFVDLHGADSEPTELDMLDLLGFLNSIHFPPNPYRRTNGSLQNTPLFDGGIPSAGVSGFNTCRRCHFPNEGFGLAVMSPVFRGDSQSFNAVHVSNMHEKTGFDRTRQDNNRGFGYLHDGHADTLFTLLSDPVFGPGGLGEAYPNGPAGDQIRRNVAAFMLSTTDPTGLAETHPGAGQQTSILVGASGSAGSTAGAQEFMNIVQGMGPLTRLGITVKGVIDGQPRGFLFELGGEFQSDRQAETYSLSELVESADAGSTLVLTLEPIQNVTRTAIDRDTDGFLDRDELDVCSDPANRNVTPMSVGRLGDADANGIVDRTDFARFVVCMAGANDEPSEICACQFDFNRDGRVDFADLGSFQLAFSGEATPDR